MAMDFSVLITHTLPASISMTWVCRRLSFGSCCFLLLLRRGLAIIRRSLSSGTQCECIAFTEVGKYTLIAFGASTNNVEFANSVVGGQHLSPLLHVLCRNANRIGFCP